MISKVMLTIFFASSWVAMIALLTALFAWALGI